MAKYVTVEERKANVYRKVEAMYRKGFDVNAISRAVELCLSDTYDIIQKIYYLDIRASRI